MATVRTLDSCFLAGKIRAPGEEVEVRDEKELASARRHGLVEDLGVSPTAPEPPAEPESEPPAPEPEPTAPEPVIEDEAPKTRKGRR